MIQNNIGEILVVDDTPDSVKLLTNILVSQGYSVYSVNSGELAIERVKLHKPSIIFLDIMMPGMDGFDVCRYLKAQEETTNLPIIFISCLDDEQLILKGYELGGIDYIVKPFHKKDVLNKVLPLLELPGNISKLKSHAYELLTANKRLENLVPRRKREDSAVYFDELFDIKEIQQLQDQFAKAFNIASIITYPDGTPITEPSNFTDLCKNIIRCSEIGLKNCMYSDSVLGRHNTEGPSVQKCLSCGLLDAGASIIVGGKHVANWLIGQVRDDNMDVTKLKAYANEIGSDEDEFLDALLKVPSMSRDAFRNISDLLFTMAGQLSNKAYQSVQQSRYINERINSETALLKSEERFRKIINSSPAGMLFYDLHEGKNLILNGSNPAADRILGIKGIELFGKSIEDVFPGLVNSKVPELFIKVANSELETQSFEIEYEDSQVCGIFDVTAFRTGNNSIAVTFLNITERKLAEKSLRESEAKFRQLAESTRIGIWIYQGDRWIYTNPAGERITEYPKKEFCKLKIWDFASPEYHEIIREKAAMRMLGEKSIEDYEVKIITKEGNIKWVLISGSQIIFKGKPAGLLSIIDITQQKESEILIKQSEELYRSIFQMSLATMLLIDPETGKIIDANDAAVEFYGWSYNKLLKMELSQINILTSKEIKRELQKAINENKSYFRFKHRIANGSFRDVEVYSSRIILNNKEILFSIIHDISERKQMEDQLLQSEERFRKAIIEAPFPIMLHAEDEEVIAISNAWSELSGYTHNDIKTTREWSIRAFGKENVSVKKYIDELYSFDHWVDEGEFTILSKSGEEKIWDFGSAPLGRLSDGRRLVISMARDVSDRVRYQESIKNDRILLRTLIDNLPVAVYIKDQNCRKIIANATDMENIGVKDESQIIGKTDLELFDGEIGSRGYADDLDVIQTGQPVVNREEVFVDKNGKNHWMLTSKMPLFDEHGIITGLVGIGRDITERKKQKELINKLTKSIEQSPSSVVITDINGTIEYVNPKFCEITGYTSEEAIGKNPRILKSGKMPDDLYKKLWETLLSGEIWRGEFLNKKKNGELYWEWATLTPLKDEHGQITNYISIKEDISQRKQMESDLVLAKEKAEESDRLKSAFLANMSHEIRTPLNAIVGFSELLADSFYDSEQNDEFIKHIIHNGDILLTIISDIMDISKMESGEITLRKSHVDVNKLLIEVTESHLMNIKDKGLELKLTTQNNENIFVSVFADVVRLRQIFNNLIGNALKFTERGGVYIGYSCHEKFIEFYIKDTGIGIPRDFHEVVFDRFRQVETSYVRRFGGTGLGLAITKNLIEVMGGKIWLQSEPEQGTTFFFTLPV